MNADEYLAEYPKETHRILPTAFSHEDLDDILYLSVKHDTDRATILHLALKEFLINHRKEPT